MTFFASTVDEESTEVLAATVSVPIVIAETIAQGTVTEVHDREFMMKAHAETLRVNVDDMSFNPLGNDDYLRIDVGDRVRVSVDSGLFAGQERTAETIMKFNR